MSSIEVKGLSKSWGEIEAVKNVSFVVPEKSFTVLLYLYKTISPFYNNNK